LLQILAPQASRFQALPASAEVELACVIYAADDRPAIHLSADVVRQLAQLGAGIDVDYYDLA